MNSDRRFGESSRTLRRVGLMSLATGRSCLTSGRVLAWNSSSRSSVSRVSFSNVGATWKNSRSDWSSDARASKVVFEPVIASASWPSRSLRASKTVPVSRTRPCS